MLELKQETLHAITDKTNRILMTQGIPSLSLAITKNNKRKILSFSSDSKPHAPRKHYMLSSIAKTFTAFAVINHARQLNFSLFDPITKHIPALKQSNPLLEKIHIIDLLGHTAGLDSSRYGWAGYNKATSKIGVLAAFEDSLTNPHVNSDRMGSWSYSNTAYDLLGALIEKKSKEQFSDFMTEKVLIPYGLTETFFDKDKIPTGSLHPPTLFTNGESLTLTDPPNVKRHQPSAVMYSNIEDVASWATFLCNPNESSPADFNEITKLMWTPRTKTGISYCKEYGLGWYIANWAKLSVIGHGGREHGYNTLLLLFPKSSASISMMTNTHHVDIISHAVEITKILTKDGILSK